MLFNTLAFPFFLVPVFLAYWCLSRLGYRWQNVLLLLVNLAFYGLWDVRWLPILLVNSMSCFLFGMAIGASDRLIARRLLLAMSLSVSLGILLLLKYFNFFAGSMGSILGLLGIRTTMPLLKFLLPVGISFYTLMMLSYPLDIYFRRLDPTRDLVAFLAFSSFFPVIVSGPIERARNMLPQFTSERLFQVPEAKDGLRQFLWGLLMKVAIADNLAPVVDDIFSRHGQLDGLTLCLGAVFFTFQIYCDFAGFSYMAIGTARLLGIRVMRNFAFPYLSRDIAEFWRRWHISLSTWFRDYIFMPFCGDRPSRARKVWGILLTFGVSGLWHGAAWTFVAWGLLHGLFFVPRTLHRRKRKSSGAVVAQATVLPNVRDTLSIMTTFLMVTLAWILFRAPTVSSAVSYVARIASHPFEQGMQHLQYWQLILACLGLFLIEWLQRKRKHGLDVAFLPAGARWSIYYAALLIIVFLGNFGGRGFIYVKF